MRRTIMLSLVLITLMSIGLVSVASAAPAGGGKQVVGYFIEWGIYARNYTVQNVVTSGSAGKLTTINYAFANVVPDGSGHFICQLFDEWADYQKPWDASQSVDGQAVTWPNPVLGNFQQLKALKAMYPKLKVLISLGGWTGSSNFSDAALPANRAAFVSSCVDLFIKGNLPDPGWGGMGGPGAAAGIFDGIDIDWEYPGAPGATNNYRVEDTKNFTALLAEFRKQMDAVKPGLLLTIAAPSDPKKIDKIQAGAVSKYLDWINVMSYDYHVATEPITNFNSPLYSAPHDPARALHFNTADSIKYWQRQGAPTRKLVVGVPFYGRGWQGVPSKNNGLWQPSTGPAAGTWEAGVEDYKVLKTKGYPRYELGGASRVGGGSAWLYNAAQGIFWTYDDPAVMKAKRAFVDQQGLGGVMFWELSGDTTNGELLGALTSGGH